jgi:hypothetical protein
MFNNYIISVFKSDDDVRELSESEIIEKEKDLSLVLINILKHLGLQSLKIRELQKVGFKVKWKNGQDVGFDMLPMLIRDCTRGNCACRLSGDNFYAYIGEDNCLYVGCELNQTTISMISLQYGLYSNSYKQSYFSKESDYEFKTKHPIGYTFLIILGLIVLFAPMIFYLVIANSINPEGSFWMILGVVGALVFSFGLYNFVDIIINQYLGHKFSIITLLLGALLMFISIQLL